VTLGAAGAITITGQSSLFVDPALWPAGLAPDAAIDGDVGGNFLTTANVYRIYTSDEDTTYAPVEFAWQRPTSIPFQVMYGTMQLWNPELGIVTPIPATWDATDEEWEVAYFSCLEDEPHLARIWYYSGWSSSTQGKMEEPYARAVAALATALLTRPVCGCGRSQTLANYWQDPPAENEPVYFERLNCPWGVRRGALEAYWICQNRMDVEGVSV